MNNDNRITGNFLEAIQKYADSHKRRIEEEAEEFKQRELKKAEDKALEEAYEIIQNQISRERTDVRIQLARREQESRRKLFLQRQKLTEKVFEKAEKELLEFTKTEEYGKRLIESAKKMAELFGAEDCTLFLRECDLSYRVQIASLFKGDVQIKADSKILIGGIRGVCEAKAVCADQTIDSLLNGQYDWFISNSGLKVV